MPRCDFTVPCARPETLSSVGEAKAVQDEKKRPPSIHSSRQQSQAEAVPSFDPMQSGRAIHDPSLQRSALGKEREKGEGRGLIIMAKRDSLPAGIQNDAPSRPSLAGFSTLQ